MRKERERDRSKQEKSEERKAAEDQKPPIDNRHHEGMPAHQRNAANASTSLQDYLKEPGGNRPRVSLRSTANGGGRR